MLFETLSHSASLECFYIIFLFVATYMFKQKICQLMYWFNSVQFIYDVQIGSINSHFFQVLRVQSLTHGQWLPDFVVIFGLKKLTANKICSLEATYTLIDSFLNSSIILLAMAFLFFSFRFFFCIIYQTVIFVPILSQIWQSLCLSYCKYI